MAAAGTARRAGEGLRPGWVVRCYPAVLESWYQLSPVARVAAQVLYSECEPGDLVEIRHAVFYTRLPCSDETSSRHAFARLEAAGMLRCVFRSRGRQGRTIYRLGDPVEAYQRRGLGVVEADPQMMLPFSDEAELGQEIDLGGGILRLVTGCDESRDSCEESGRSAGLNGKESGRIAGLTAKESGRSAGLNSPGEREHGCGTGCQSAEPVTSKAVGSGVSPGNGGIKPRELGTVPSPTFCVAALQDSQDLDLFLVKVKESILGLTPAARAVWERLRAQLAASDWDSYLARCCTESDQDGSGLVIVAPDEWSGERIRRLLRGSGLMAGVTIRSEPAAATQRPPPATAEADSGRVWSLRIRQAIADCGGQGDTALPAGAVDQAARYLARQQLPAKRVDRLLEKIRQRRPANPGGWLNTCLAELCAQCGLAWRETGRTGRRLPR